MVRGLFYTAALYGIVFKTSTIIALIVLAGQTIVKP